MSALTDLTVKEFMEVTASDAPAPGGGSIAAMTGSSAAALAEMVSVLTIGRARYRDAEEVMQQVQKSAAEIREKLLTAVDRDKDSFVQYMQALKLPKTTDEEKSVRQAAMQAGLKAAALIPLEVAETAVRIFPLAKEAAERGNVNAVTDALVAAMAAKTSVLSAILNCRINLSSITDEAFVSKASGRADALVKYAIEQERAILKAHEISADF